VSFFQDFSKSRILSEGNGGNGEVLMHLLTDERCCWCMAAGARAPLQCLLSSL